MTQVAGSIENGALQIPQACVFKKPKNITAGKFEGLDVPITWIASLKAGIADVTPVDEGRVRFTEINVFSLELIDADELYSQCRDIFAKVKYPLILQIQNKNRFLYAVCYYQAGLVDRSKNVNRKIYFSHWLRHDMISPDAQSMMHKINEALNSTSDIETIYRAIVNAVANYSLGGQSFAATKKLLHFLIGRQTKQSAQKLLRYCSPYKYYSPVSSSVAVRYNASARSSSYHLLHDTEEVWYCIMHDEKAKAAWEGRRYSSMAEFQFRYDEWVANMDEYELSQLD